VAKKRSQFWARALEESDVWFEESQSLDPQQGGRGLREPFLCLDTSEVLWPQFHKQLSTAASAKGTFSPSPLVSPLAQPPPASCWPRSEPSRGAGPGHACSAPALSPLVPLTPGSPLGRRGERAWLFRQRRHPTVFLKPLFQTVWHSQTRENAILLTAMKAGRPTSVSCCTATKHHYGLWWEKTFLLPFPKEGKAHGGTAKLQSRGSTPEAGSEPPAALTATACSRNPRRRARTRTTWAARKAALSTACRSCRHTRDTDCSAVQKLRSALSKRNFNGIVWAWCRACSPWQAIKLSLAEQVYRQRVWKQWEAEWKPFWNSRFWPGKCLEAAAGA